jgi:hypothetical protein
LPLKITKRAEEMTEEEMENFVRRYLTDGYLEILYWDDKEKKIKAINFFIDHLLSGRKASEMTEEEKDEIVKFLESFPGNEGIRESIAKIGKDNVIDSIISSLLDHRKKMVGIFSIQHYDFDGNFIEQWPKGNKLELSDEIRNKIGEIPVVIIGKEIEKINAIDQLINPLFIDSDEEGNIYLADYGGNKIIKFNSRGDVLNLWKMKENVNKLDSMEYDNCGFTIKNRKVYLVSGDFNPWITEYDLEGRIIRKKEIKSLKVSRISWVLGYKIPIERDEEEDAVLNYFGIGNARINDIGVDNRENIYLKVEDRIGLDKGVFILDKNLNKVGYIRTVLKKGFDRLNIPYISNPKERINYRMLLYKLVINKLLDIEYHIFNTAAFSGWLEGGPGLYSTSNLILDSDDNIYITFVGLKIFGVIDAMIFNNKGKMIGYWKQRDRIYTEWIRNSLYEVKDLKGDIELDIAFYKDFIYIGRVMSEGYKNNNIIQKFIREGKND